MKKRRRGRSNRPTRQSDRSTLTQPEHPIGLWIQLCRCRLSRKAHRRAGRGIVWSRGIRQADPARSVRPGPDAGLPSAAPRNRLWRPPKHGLHSESQLLPAGSARTYRARCRVGYPDHARRVHTGKSERVRPRQRGSHRDSGELRSGRRAVTPEATSLCICHFQLPLSFSGKPGRDRPGVCFARQGF
jgi:hypothetical protein